MVKIARNSAHLSLQQGRHVQQSQVVFSSSVIGTATTMGVLSVAAILESRKKISRRRREKVEEG